MRLQPHHLATLSQVAYYSEPAAIDFSIATGFEIIDFFDVAETQCYVFSVPELLTPHPSLVVAFRGTEPYKLRDWLVNLESRKVDWLFGKVHAGFLKALNSVWTPLKSCLSAYKTYAHIYTGHSLGAALSTIASVKAGFNGVYPHQLVTFGSPRVGDRKFTAAVKALLNGSSIRYVNNNDIVPRVPLSAEFLFKYIPYGHILDDLVPIGFSHVAGLRHIKTDGNIVREGERFHRIKIIRDRLRGRLIAGKDWYKDGLQDHNMSNYVALTAQDTFG